MKKSTDDMSMHEFGLYLGYPQCCVESLCDDVRDRRRLASRGDRQLSGTGFVPCARCNETKTAEQLIKEINTNRQHDVPFPDMSF